MLASLISVTIGLGYTPVASAAEQNRLRDALTRDDLFTVVVDCFTTDTADYADIVLPAAGFLEFDDITFSYMNPIMGVQQKVREPIGESLPNQEIFRRLAAAMGFDEPALVETDEDIIARIVETIPGCSSYEELKELGHVVLSDEPLDFFASGSFRTPSGRIEIASEKAESRGLGRLPTPTTDARPTGDQFRIVSPASKWRMNDSYANDPALARRAGDADVVMHPSDATRLGLAEGQRVLLENAAGSLELSLRVDDIVEPGVLLAYKGRWPKLEAGGANVNVLHEPRSTEIPGTSAVHGTVVTISPARADGASPLS